MRVSRAGHEFGGARARAARAVGLIVATVLAWSLPARAADPAPRTATTPTWSKRCEARLTALGAGPGLAPSIGSAGKAKVVISAPTPAGPFGERGRFGRVTLQLATRAGAWTASVGDDAGRRKHRPDQPGGKEAGIVARQFGGWHAAVVDTTDEAPAPETLRDELHARLPVGVLTAEVRAQGGTEAARLAFEAAVAPTLEACIADVLPDEGDPSLGWTTTCLAQLGGAFIAATARAPGLAAGSCRRGPFQASCGLVQGRELTFNALLLVAGERPRGAKMPPAEWTMERGDPRRLNYADTALIWAHQASEDEWQALRDAFKAPLAACAALSWAASRAR